MDELISKQEALDALTRVGLWKIDTKESLAVAECLREVKKLQPVESEEGLKDHTEKYKDCFQPKSNQQHLNEEIAKVFQFGMAFGFIESLNANKNDIPLDELRAELEDYITHSPYIKSFTDCCRLRDDVLRIIDKYKKVRKYDRY